jgi:sRNA-binding protein
MRKVFAIALLSLGLAACEPSTTDNSNANSNTRANAPAAATPAPASPTPEPAASAKPELKAGDKVKVTVGGTSVEATVVSVDEKAGKATVKIQGQKEKKTVAFADIVKE